MSDMVGLPFPTYSPVAENLRGHIANSLQIVQGMLADLREREGEPFLLGAQDDLDGVRLRLKYALDILDSRP